MIQQLTDFLTAGNCLHCKLSHKVQDALTNLSDKLSKDSYDSPALATFDERRVAFFENWTHVLLTTTPWAPNS
ncbi:hypothetical protein Y699_07845 [Aspergillus fumigatus Z5]|nr:hypothetical protein Y699_07845 [Aspergillus fumigatus Z5]